MAADGPKDDVRRDELQEALTRLADAERVAAILEARLHQYQTALETIHGAAKKAPES